MTIRVLENPVIDAIAAGEVIERPASVVRELVDNAIDAGADDVAVFFDGGGIVRIAVRDNGAGIPAGELPLAVLRHATSKVSEIDDLRTVQSYGFRGEALASIAAVAMVQLSSRRADDSFGASIRVVRGEPGEPEQISFNEGTEIEVRGLFANVPARKKFLKSERSENLKVKQWLQHFSLAVPHVRLRLQIDGKEVLHFPKRANWMERAREIFRGTLIDIDGKNGPLRLIGSLGHPASAKSSAQSLVLFVNGRMIQDRALLRAVKDGFGGTLKDRQYPVGFLMLSIPPEFVDINVHPQKSEVRFWDSGQLFRFVRDGVRAGLNEFQSEMPIAHPASSPEVQHRAAETPNEDDLGPGSPQHLFAAQLGGTEPTPAARDEAFRFSSLRYVGQVLGVYLVCEHDGALVVVDMHAAHERYNYNLILNRYRQDGIPSQMYTSPIQIEVEAEQAERIEAIEDELSRLGFSLSITDEGDRVELKGGPTLIDSARAQEAIEEVLQLEEAAGMDGWLSDAAARLACHASIRSGKEMTREEVYSLFEALDRTEFSSACPHGRPVVISFPEAKLERMFGRVQ